MQRFGIKLVVALAIWLVLVAVAAGFGLLGGEHG